MFIFLPRFVNWFCYKRAYWDKITLTLVFYFFICRSGWAQRSLIRFLSLLTIPSKRRVKTSLFSGLSTSKNHPKQAAFSIMKCPLTLTCIFLRKSLFEKKKREAEPTIRKMGAEKQR